MKKSARDDLKLEDGESLKTYEPRNPTTITSIYNKFEDLQQ